MIAGLRPGGRCRSAALWFAALMLATTVLAVARPAVAKEIELTGTADCGQRSGALCVVGDMIALWTKDIDGTKRRVTIDVSWIRNQLDGLRQDDLLHLEVLDLGGGRYQAIAVHEPPKQPPPRREKDDKVAAQADQVPGLVQVSIGDGYEDESDSRLYHFDITLSAASSQTVTVRFSTRDGDPPDGYRAGIEYVAVINLLVTFPPGTTTQTVDVTLLESNCNESVRHFFGTIASPVNAVIADDVGIAEIPPQPC